VVNREGKAVYRSPRAEVKATACVSLWNRNFLHASHPEGRQLTKVSVGNRTKSGTPWASGDPPTHPNFNLMIYLSVRAGNTGFVRIQMSWMAQRFEFGRGTLYFNFGAGPHSIASAQNQAHFWLTRCAY